MLNINEDTHSLMVGQGTLPVIIEQVGAKAGRRFVEFFTANIRNPNTRLAYARAIMQFLGWCESRGLTLQTIKPVAVAAYIEQHPGSRPTVKQHLAAIRMLFDWLVTGQLLRMNPAASVRGPKYVVKRGKTPALTAEEAREFFASIDTSSISGLRDRAILGVLIYSFARVGAVVSMRVEDYYKQGRRSWFRLHEKGGKRHEVPAHHKAEVYVDTYLEAAGIWHDKKGPLFRTLNKHRKLTRNSMQRREVLAMIKRRARGAGLPSTTSCHTFRATGITAYLGNGGTLEKAQAIAAHESARTTKLYDRTSDEITLDEVERIAI